jgi:hypothetical protein
LTQIKVAGTGGNAAFSSNTCGFFRFTLQKALTIHVRWLCPVGVFARLLIMPALWLAKNSRALTTKDLGVPTFREVA